MTRIRYTSGVSRGLIQEIPDDAADALIRGGMAVPAKPTLADFANLGAPPGEKPMPPQRAEPTKETSPTQQKTAFDRLLELVGSDLIEIFGDYGTGKSRLVGHIALEAQESGKKVLFLDDENSLPRSITSKLNYQYVGIDLDNIIPIVSGLKDHYDLVCLDSIGFPVLVKYFELNLRERLTALGKMILLRGYLKDYAIQNKGLAIVTNQPVSEFSYSEYSAHPTPKNQPLEPFGGKGAFISKLLLRTDPIQRGETTKIAVKTYKARDLPFDKQIAEFTITDGKTDLRWL